MAATLVFELHGRLMRDIARLTGCEYQGLRSAAGSLRRLHLVKPSLAKQLTRLDDTFAVLRHINVVRAEKLHRQLAQALAGTCDQLTSSSVPPGTSATSSTSCGDSCDDSQAGVSTLLATDTGSEVLYFDLSAGDVGTSEVSVQTLSAAVSDYGTQTEVKVEALTTVGQVKKFRVGDGRGRHVKQAVAHTAAVSCTIGWELAAIPPSVRRPWHVFEEDLEDKIGDASSQGAEVNVETRERLAMVQKCGAPAAFAALPKELQRTYAEVSLLELSAFACWRRGQVKSANDGAPRLKVDFEAWDLLDDDDKAEWVPVDPYSALIGDTLWAPLLAAAAPHERLSAAT